MTGRDLMCLALLVLYDGVVCSEQAHRFRGFYFRLLLFMQFDSLCRLDARIEHKSPVTFMFIISKHILAHNSVVILALYRMDGMASTNPHVVECEWQHSCNAISSNWYILNARRGS